MVVATGDLDAELVRPVGLALADAFDFRGVQGIDLGSALALLLLAHAPRQHEQLCEGVGHAKQPGGDGLRRFKSCAE